MKVSTLLLGVATLAALAACDAAKQATESTSNTATAPTPTPTGGLEKNGLRLTPFTDSPKYPTAQMRASAPVAGSTLPSGAPVAFKFELTNFALGKLSSGPRADQVANGAQGQYIFNSVDNEAYTAHYQPSFSKPLPDGQHVVLSVLARSYHETLKHRGASDLRLVTVGQPVPGAPAIDLKAPHLFYGRPQGTYSGRDAQKVVLDFYLANVALEPGGTQVRATINGSEFPLDQWAPYIMEGLPIGENTVKLELVDASGNLIPGPFNSVTRTFSVQP